MKGRNLLFAVCIGCLAIGGRAAADDASNARAATRRTQTGVANTNTAQRQKVSADSARAGVSARGNNANTKNNPTSSPRTIGARTTVVSDATRTGADTTTPRSAVTARTGIIQTRPVVSTARTATSTVSRAATPARATTARTATPTRTATRTRTTNASRAATNNTELREAIMGRDYKTCRQVYYECMDEFCANKDAQLKRCACSSRLHDFDRVKQSLTNVEDKLLDFNQRLLTVNMDKEDAAALFTATEGELAYNQKDTSASKKILDEISKKLNSNTNDSFNQNLSAISLSLNADAAFDNVDSLMGASTTSKEGVALYNAALPICREMAAEVCDDEALAIAESGYQMTIEQDCNTIAKTYETQTDQAREKIREGGALLDISRLDIYQKRNSDDILTCKKKMLTQLFDTSVCGDGLSKCLDMSGQYIDPSTGQAFLTTNLANLSTLITRPTGNQTWTNAPGNDRFISYLNSKKKYLEPAMENCQDIADSVWDEFVEDALSQIKLAQDAKLEEVRQSCTTLTTQCLSDTAKSISDFDARALSTFGVKADKTVNDMCASVQNACTALLETVGGDQDWVGGMTQIATDKTYDTIMQTCREVGRACIIQACKSISGNFGMCENTENSVNRKAIINRTSCWAEVQACVAEAGTDAINQIFNQIETDNLPNGGSFYNELYHLTKQRFTNNKDATQHCYQEDGTTTCIFDMCANECGCSFNDQEGLDTCSAQNTVECRTCRLTEKIWGNCEAVPAADISKKNSHNRILIPSDTNTTTLLSWFAQNTGTAGQDDSCRDTTCPSGFKAAIKNDMIVCISADEFDTVNNYCPQNEGFLKFFPISSDRNLTNCCRSDFGNDSLDAIIKGIMVNQSWCCLGANKTTESNINVPFYGTTPATTGYTTCTPDTNTKSYNVVGNLTVNGIPNIRLVCISDATTPIDAPGENESPDSKYPSGDTIHCNGKFVYVDANGRHIDPHNAKSYMSYMNNDQELCTYDSNTNKWLTKDLKDCAPPDNWIVNIGQ